MTKQPPSVMPWTVVIGIIVLGALFAWGVAVSNMRTEECEARGGTFFQNRSGSSCIKDGKIIIIWQNGQKFDNP
jgi:hypothetical protein